MMFVIVEEMAFQIRNLISLISNPFTTYLIVVMPTESLSLLQGKHSCETNGGSPGPFSPLTVVEDGSVECFALCWCAPIYFDFLYITNKGDRIRFRVGALLCDLHACQSGQ